MYPFREIVSIFLWSWLALAVAKCSAMTSIYDSKVLDFSYDNMAMLQVDWVIEHQDAQSKEREHQKVDTTDRLAFTQILTVLVVFCLAGGLLLSGFLWQPCNHKDSLEKVSAILSFALYTDNLGFTLLILDSYQLCQHLGEGPVFSGCLIAAYKVGCGIGSVVTRLTASNPEFLLPKSRQLLFGAFAVQLLFAVAFSVTSYSVILSSLSVEHAQRYLILFRCLQGTGAGVIAFYMRVIFSYIEPDNVANRQETIAFWITLGLGSGPVLAAASRAMMHSETSGTASAAAWTVVVPVFPFLQVLSLLAFPCLEAYRNHDNPQLTDSPGSISDNTVWNRKQLQVACLIFRTCRCFSVSSLEAASALIMETEFGCDPRFTGVMISLCFCTVIIFRLIQQCTRQVVLKERERQRGMDQLLVLQIVTLIGALLLHPHSCLLVLGQGTSSYRCVYILLLGDALLFPGFMTGDGVVAGVATANVLPTGSIFDLNNMNLATMLMMDVVGRGLGPPMARWWMSLGGQEWYAIQQLIVCFGGILLVGFITGQVAVINTNLAEESDIIDSTGG